MANHGEKFYVRFAQNRPVNMPGDFKVFTGSIYGRYNANQKPIFWVCDCYYLYKGKLPVHVFNGKDWKLQYLDKAHPICKWVVYAIRKLGRIPKIDTESLTLSDCENLMKSYALHKKGTGSRLNTNQINGPLRWNEVTEIAHWYGKGNASVVACGIK